VLKDKRIIRVGKLAFFYEN